MATDSILPRGTGQWMEDADGPRWWFDSGSLALDFAYTGGLDRPEESQPVADAAALNDWLSLIHISEPTRLKGESREPD